MPVSFPPVHPYPGKYRTLGDAARDNLLIVLRCNGCHRKVNFLASDLAEVIGKTHYAHVPPFKCSRCETDEYIDVSARYLDTKERGRTIVRRPAMAGKICRWHDEPV